VPKVIVTKPVVMRVSDVGELVGDTVGEGVGGTVGDAVISRVASRQELPTRKPMGSTWST